MVHSGCQAPHAYYHTSERHHPVCFYSRALALTSICPVLTLCACACGRNPRGRPLQLPYGHAASGVRGHPATVSPPMPPLSPSPSTSLPADPEVISPTHLSRLSRATGRSTGRRRTGAAAYDGVPSLRGSRRSRDHARSKERKSEGDVHETTILGCAESEVAFD